MIFGIKTKKDKRIEELDKKIEELEKRNDALIYSLTLKPHMVETGLRDIQVYEYATVLEDGEPVEWAKERIALEFRFMIRDDIFYDITTDKNTGKNILHGRIGVSRRLGGESNANKRDET